MSSRLLLRWSFESDSGMILSSYRLTRVFWIPNELQDDPLIQSHHCVA